MRRKDKAQFKLSEDDRMESVVITTIIRLVAPFSLTYGLFMTFNGANTPGGSFQGATIVSATILMIALGFGTNNMKEKIPARMLVLTMSIGAIIFGLVAISTILFGGYLLDHSLLTALGIEKGIKWSMEAIEVGGIFFIILGVFVGLFFAISSGIKKEEVYKYVS